MTKRLVTAFAALTTTGFFSACTDTGNNPATRTAQGVVGEWKSESVTRQVAINAKFRADGTCYLQESGGTELPCTWSAPGEGQNRIAIAFSGRSEASYASLDGDRLFIHEPARDTLFVREVGYKLLTSLRPLFSGN